MEEESRSQTLAAKDRRETMKKKKKTKTRRQRTLKPFEERTFDFIVWQEGNSEFYNYQQKLLYTYV
jgi:hypothetical protein